MGGGWIGKKQEKNKFSFFVVENQHIIYNICVHHDSVRGTESLGAINNGFTIGMRCYS